MKFNKKKVGFYKVSAIALVILFMVGYGSTATYQTLRGEPDYTATQFLTTGLKKGTHNLASHVTTSAKTNARNEAVKSQRLTNQRSKKRVVKNTKAVSQNPKRLAVVAKYISTNYHQHNLKRAVYNRQLNKIQIQFKNRRLSNAQRGYAKQLLNSYNVK